MTSDELAGVLRHVLTIAGGYFVSKGIIDASTLTVVVAALASLAGVAMSILAKRKAK